MGFNCKNCGECCGPAPITKEELRKIKKFLKLKNLKLPKVLNKMECRFRQEEKCLIYPVRPIVCKLFGTYENLVCDKNDVKLKPAIRSKNKPIKLINDLSDEDVN